MALPPTLDLNGRPYSHASTDIRLFGLRMRGCKEWSWKITVEHGEMRGAAREAMGHTIGDVKYESSAVFFRQWWDAYKDDCRALGLSPVDRMGVITIVVAEPGKPAKKAEIYVTGLSEAEVKSSSGPEPHEVPVSFRVLTVLEDGKALIDRSIFGVS